jgi:hypothetical protein
MLLTTFCRDCRPRIDFNWRFFSPAQIVPSISYNILSEAEWSSLQQLGILRR